MRLYYSETFVCMSLYYSDTSSSQSSNPTKHHSYISVVYMHVSSSSRDACILLLTPFLLGGPIARADPGHQEHSEAAVVESREPQPSPWFGVGPHQAEHTPRHKTVVFRSGETCPEAGSKRALPSDKSGALPPETGRPLNNMRARGQVGPSTQHKREC